MNNKARPCSCGSGKNSLWQYDARGIPLTRACSDCRDEKLLKYRPEVLKNPNYSVNESIEEEG